MAVFWPSQNHDRTEIWRPVILRRILLAMRSPAALVLLFLALVLAACSSSGGGTSAPTSAVVHRQAMSAAFLHVVRPVVPGASNASLVGLGRAICRDLRGGASWVHEIAALVRVSHLSGYKAGEMTGASIAAFCPEQKSKAP